MSDLKHLPNAWKIIYKMDGEEGNEKDGLYEIYYQISTAIFNYRLKHNFSQNSLKFLVSLKQWFQSLRAAIIIIQLSSFGKCHRNLDLNSPHKWKKQNIWKMII